MNKTADILQKFSNAFSFFTYMFEILFQFTEICRLGPNS